VIDLLLDKQLNLLTRPEYSRNIGRNVPHDQDQLTG